MLAIFFRSRTEYESECWTKQEEHDVQDDVVECRTEVERDIFHVFRLIFFSNSNSTVTSPKSEHECKV